jgi:hypothetical protein
VYCTIDRNSSARSPFSSSTSFSLSMISPGVAHDHRDSIATHVRR